jgi:thioredoxin 1
MRNADEELNQIMAKKMKDLARQMSNSYIDNKLNVNISDVAANSSPITLSDANFAQTIDKYPLVVVDFWAPWCGPCRMVSPIIEQLANELAGKAVFGKLNIDENPNISNAFGIQSIPTIAIFKNGKAVDGIMGAVPKSQILSKISKYMDH